MIRLDGAEAHATKIGLLKSGWVVSLTNFNRQPVKRKKYFMVSKINRQ